MSKYECENCLKTFASKQGLTKHTKNNVCVGKQYAKGEASDENHKCEFCNKLFTTATSMYRHVNHTCKIKKRR